MWQGRSSPDLQIKWVREQAHGTPTRSQTVIGEFIKVLRGRCSGMVQDAPGAKDLVVGQARVAFEGVSFEYSAGTPVLQDVNFTAEGGATIALVGATGSGAPPPLPRPAIALYITQLA